MNRRQSLGLATLSALAVCVAAGATLRMADLPPAAEKPLAYFTFGACAVAMGLCVAHWRALDEAAKEAHKLAWYWGGTGGLLAACVFVAWLQAQPVLDLVPPAPLHGDTGLLATGLLLAAGAQLTGYALVWAGWWLKRR